MASPTRQTESIRARKRSKKGRDRKAQLRNQGSTPSDKELFGDN